MYIFTNHCIGLNLHILPAVIKSPNGSENTKVSTNIDSDANNPLDSCLQISKTLVPKDTLVVLEVVSSRNTSSADKQTLSSKPHLVAIC